MNENDYKTFKYFLESYFNVSANYNELEQLIQEFNTIENSKYRESFKNELEQMLEEKDWDSIKEIVKVYGMRNMSHDKLIMLVKKILKNIN
ncbi:hypothetical protein EV207_11767 [Scopulibacillus darangshiensis]|uniref:CdiI immunity protein domain-containing protein n=1 Tax=Scopulibacillus darangshiensis TaxID=442528 RepID=A0A4R2NZT7_9BACL|nr:hypothetical protein [Scopulibacillus darangshiensis]TCP27840.1 hypothetical protein EV207_11767 [Scopulibacillus darangshiensis]